MTPAYRCLARRWRAPPAIAESSRDSVDGEMKTFDYWFIDVTRAMALQKLDLHVVE